jgi:single-strand DNA-binding protein
VIVATICGNLGKDAEVREAGDSTVTAFSVASTAHVKGEKVTTWCDCSMWGRRGQAVSQYLSKGTRVMVAGELTTRMFKDKLYLELRVDQLELLGGGKREDSDDRPKGGSARRPAEHRKTDATTKYNEDTDDVPF